MKSFGRIAIGGIGLGLGIAATSLAYEADLGRDVANVEVGPLYEDAVERDIASGDCWTEGDHGYPTRMWTLETDQFGSYYVDTSAQDKVDAAVEQMFNGIDHGYTVIAFCDGVTLN